MDVDTLMAVGALGIASSGVLAGWLDQRRTLRRAEEAWRKVASELGLLYTPTPATLLGRLPTRLLEGSLDGAHVRATSCWVGRKGARASTEIVATSPGVPRCFDFRLGVDTSFRIEAADPVLARTTLGPALRRRLEPYAGSSFRFRDRAVSMTIGRELTDAVWFGELLSVMAAFSAAPSDRLAGWTALAHKLGGVVASGHDFVDHGTLPAITLRAHGLSLSLKDDAATDRLILQLQGEPEPAVTLPHPAADPFDDEALLAQLQQAVETATASLGVRPYR